MKERDWKYIEGRLLDPAGSVVEAVNRLYELDRKYEATLIMAKLKDLHDVCGTVRRNLAGEHHGR